MTFDELVAEVYTKTGRPDRVEETKSAIRAATLKAHHSDFFFRDIFETGVVFSTASCIQTLDLPCLLCNFRSLSYLRRVENAQDTEGTFFDIILPTEILDEYSTSRVDIAYMAGRKLQMRASVDFSNILLGAYVSPIVTEADYSSWVAQLFPYAIIYEATRVVFRQIGNMEESNAFGLLVAEEYVTLKITGISPVGF